MNKPQAAHTSRQIIDSGYLDWMAGEVDAMVFDMLRGIDPVDADALMVNRVKLDLVPLLRQIVHANAEQHP